MKKELTISEEEYKDLILHYERQIFETTVGVGKIFFFRFGIYNLGGVSVVYLFNADACCQCRNFSLGKRW